MLTLRRFLNSPGALLMVTHKKRLCATLKMQLVCGWKPPMNLAIRFQSQLAAVWCLPKTSCPPLGSRSPRGQINWLTTSRLIVHLRLPVAFSVSSPQ